MASLLRRWKNWASETESDISNGEIKKHVPKQQVLQREGLAQKLICFTRCQYAAPVGDTRRLQLAPRLHKRLLVSHTHTTRLVFLPQYTMLAQQSALKIENMPKEPWAWGKSETYRPVDAAWIQELEITGAFYVTGKRHVLSSPTREHSGIRVGQTSKSSVWDWGYRSLQSRRSMKRLTRRRQRALENARGKQTSKPCVWAWGYRCLQR